LKMKHFKFSFFFKTRKVKAPKFSGRHRTEERRPSPPCPHKWESHEEIEKLEKSLKRKSNSGQNLRSVKTSHLQDKLETSTSKVSLDRHQDIVKHQKSLPSTMFNGKQKSEMEENKFSETLSKSAKQQETETQEEFYSRSMITSSWSGQQKVLTTKTVDLTAPRHQQSTSSENKFSETLSKSAKQQQQYFEQQQHQQDHEHHEQAINVEPQNYYQSSTTLEQVSNDSMKTAPSFGSQSVGAQGPCPIRLPVLSVAAVKTDALSSSPSLTSNLSDSSQSTVVRKNDSSTTLISKSENK
jgi:hypothetical protein